MYQKNPQIIWVGTGEANNRNDVGWGDGIYKSTDGGATFSNVGLAEDVPDRANRRCTRPIR